MKNQRDCEICLRIAQLRREVAGVRGKSSFARQLGISPSTYDYYETARVPPADILVRIAEIAQVDLRWLITGETSRDAGIVPPHPAVTKAAELLAKCPDAARPLGAFLDILSETMKFPQPSPSQGDSDEVVDEIPAVRTGWIPILGRSAAGVAHFWSDSDAEKGLTTLGDLVSRHAASLPGDVKPARASGYDVPESEVRLIALRRPEEDAPAQFVVAPQIRSRYPDVFAVRIDGNSMEPEIRHGDVVLLSPSAPAIDGRPAVVQLRGQIGVTCKIIRRDGGTVHLAAVNENFAPQSFPLEKVAWSLRVLARVRPGTD